jgi:hypothetical protein
MVYTELLCIYMFTEQLHYKICSIMLRYQSVPQNTLSSGCHIEFKCVTRTEFEKLWWLWLCRLQAHASMNKIRRKHEEGSHFLDLILH